MNELAHNEDFFDRIEAYYTNNSKLSDKEIEIAERFELAFALLLQHRSKKVAVSKLIKLKSISIAQAYRDLNNAERIFAPIKKYSTEFLRLVLLESAFKDIKQAEERARHATSNREWISLMDLKNKAEYRIIQVSGINNLDAELPDFSKIKPSEFNINIPEELIILFKNTASKGAIDITDLLNSTKDIEDVDCEEV